MFISKCNLVAAGAVGLVVTSALPDWNSSSFGGTLYRVWLLLYATRLDQVVNSNVASGSKLQVVNVNHHARRRPVPPVTPDLLIIS